jgi:excisionase family DNA binding protein
MPRSFSDKAPTARHKRRYNVRMIKATWPYSVQEIAELLGVHKNAVLRWLREGLQANRDRRPFLIRGDELARFLSARQAAKRRKCAATEFYCFKCRSPREAYLGIADVVIETSSKLRLKALCSVCSTSVNKVQGVRDLEKILSRFHVQELAGEHLLGSTAPSLNSGLENLR